MKNSLKVFLKIMAVSYLVIIAYNLSAQTTKPLVTIGEQGVQQHPKGDLRIVTIYVSPKKASTLIAEQVVAKTDTPGIWVGDQMYNVTYFDGTYTFNGNIYLSIKEVRRALRDTIREDWNI